MKFKIVLFFSVLHLAVFSQERLLPVLIDSIKTENRTIYEINKEATYYSNNNVFYKKTKLTEFDYTNLSLGNLHKVDLYNPLQIVLFYQDFNTIILLDNQLNETHRIDGNKQESILNFENVGLASRNQIWFYDFMTQKIGLYDFNSNTYKFVSTPIKNKIIYYKTDYNYFYWIDEENMFYNSSIFGKIKTLGKVPPFELIEVFDTTNYLYSFQGNLYFFNTEQNKTYEISISEKSFDNFYYKNGILSIFTPNKVINYLIQLP